MLLLLIFFTCSQLFQPTTCPPVRIFNCGLAGQNKLEASRRNNEMLRYTIDSKYPWRILEPRELSLLAPTTTTRMVYYKLSDERCDFMRMRCMEAYLTGVICARTFYYQYMSFTSYCVMVFHNCIAKFDNVWSIAYMGYCTEVDMDKHLYVEMTYDQMANNSKLQSMYIADSADITDFEGYADIPTRAPKNATISSYEITFNVTDESTSLVTIAEGSNVTTIEIATVVPQNNVTKGNLVTDNHGK